MMNKNNKDFIDACNVKILEIGLECIEETTGKPVNVDFFKKDIEEFTQKVIDEMNILISGIDHLHRILGPDRANELNLNLYNQCAEFVRKYNANEAGR